MLNSKHLSLVKKIGDKTKFTITRVHCTNYNIYFFLLLTQQIIRRDLSFQNQSIFNFSHFFQDDMDKNQKSCIDFAIQAKPLELYVPEEQSGIRYHIWRLVTSGPFENFIMLLIVCNTILLMLKVSLQF